MKTTTKIGEWRWINYCENDCGYVGADPSEYYPCPQCGGRVSGTPKAGRYVYEIERLWFLPFIKRKRIVGVQWRQSSDSPGYE